ncbi:class I SAM-dependent methyltransferase [Ectobacillus sp. sgz5001026]|uniref:class I SAM-dependent methyltransferase n=1 Tax=Ectobacillus sp. sgz5001026 TaxID=3242473 RepID=UPI0036D23AFC
MNIETYLSNISFQYIKPNTPVESDRTALEMLNTVLPEDNKYLQSIYNLCSIPKMSTFTIGTIINKIVSQMKENQYFVNVGVWHGFTFLSGVVNNPSKKCIGIDNFSEFGGPREEFLQRFHSYNSKNHLFYEMDYIDYFSHIHKGEIGFYIYDGEHSYENQLKGLQVAEPFFGEDCLIMIDDTNWEQVRKATFSFLSSSKNKYQVLADIPTYHDSHPTYWNGIILLKKIK